MEKEIWKPVKGYEDSYKLSTQGCLYSYPRRGTKGGYFYGYHFNNGYYAFKLGKHVRRLCHVLMWETFKGGIPKGYEIHHINHNRGDNRLENLCLIEKQKHLELHKENLSKSAIKTFSKPVLQYTLDKQLVGEYSSAREAERQIGINHNCISKCCLNRKHYKTAGGFIWKYKEVA